MENHSDISKNFIPYDLALELKKLGFKEECLAIYCGESEIRFRVLEKNTFINDKSSWVTAPLWQQAHSGRTVRRKNCARSATGRTAGKIRF